MMYYAQILFEFCLLVLALAQIRKQNAIGHASITQPWLSRLCTTQVYFVPVGRRPLRIHFIVAWTMPKTTGIFARVLAAWSRKTVSRKAAMSEYFTTVLEKLDAFFFCRVLFRGQFILTRLELLLICPSLWTFGIQREAKGSYWSCRQRFALHERACTEFDTCGTGEDVFVLAPTGMGKVKHFYPP